MNYYEPRNSNYCYPNSNILKNKFDVRDAKKLEEIEKVIVSSKAIELRNKKSIGNFDINHIIKIHKILFGDIYEFAGKFRNENISKGGFRFAEWEFIDEQLNILLNQLKEENYLSNLSIIELVERLAYYMAELNVLHPFREGNGRTIREFIRELAFENGYNLDFEKFESEELLEAMIRSVYNTDFLEEIIGNSIYKINERERER